MSELRRLLEAAYKAGHENGQQYDIGCSYEDFGDFDEWLNSVPAGKQVTAVAELADAPPFLSPHSTIPLSTPNRRSKITEFVIVNIEWGSAVIVTLQDRKSAEERYRL